MPDAIPDRDSTEWWLAYVERMAKDEAFNSRVSEIVDFRHTEAAAITSKRTRHTSPFGSYARNVRLWENIEARKRHPSPCPFEDGWRPSAESDAISNLVSNLGID